MDLDLFVELETNDG